MFDQKNHPLKTALLAAVLSVPYMWTGVVASLPALYNELWACFITSLVLCALFFSNNKYTNISGIARESSPALAVIGGLICSIAIQSRFGFANAYFGVTGLAIGVLMLALICVVCGAFLSHVLNDAERNALSYRAAWIVLIIGLLQAFIGLLQYLELNLISTTLMSALTIAGRVYGNLRQPNHFALLLIVSLAACFSLLLSMQETQKRTNRFLMMCVIFLVMLIVLSVSRVGLLLLILLSIWGAFKCKSKRNIQFLFISLVPLYFVFRLGFIWIDEQDILPFWGNARVFSLSASGNQDRLSIFTSVVGTLLESPVLGVGYGRLSQATFENGHAWALTKNLESAHNLFVDWALYFGMPIAIVLAVLLLLCVVRCIHHAKFGVGWLGFFVLLAPLVAHMVEYPLEFPRFLLPWAGLLGFLMVKRGAHTSIATKETDKAAFGVNITKMLSLICLLFSALVAWIAADFRKVNPIYSQSSTPFSSRVVAAYDSHFFVHLVDYAVLMASAPEPAAAKLQFRLAEKVTQVRFDGPVLSVYVPVAVLSGNVCFAKAAAYNGFKADQETYQKLVTGWLQSPHQSVRSFAEANMQPKPALWPKKAQRQCD